MRPRHARIATAYSVRRDAAVRACFQSLHIDYIEYFPIRQNGTRNANSLTPISVTIALCLGLSSIRNSSKCRFNPGIEIATAQIEFGDVLAFGNANHAHARREPLQPLRAPLPGCIIVESD